MAPPSAIRSKDITSRWARVNTPAMVEYIGQTPRYPQLLSAKANRGECFPPRLLVAQLTSPIILKCSFRRKYIIMCFLNRREKNILNTSP